MKESAPEVGKVKQSLFWTQVKVVVFYLI
jgi:hypothetical protein